MPAFNSRAQARQFIGSQTARGPKPPAEKRANDRKIRSIGTERDYTNTAENVADWMKTKKLGTLTRMTRHQAEDYPQGTGGRGRAKSARPRPHRARPAPPDGQKTPRLRGDEAPARTTSPEQPTCP